MAFLKTFGLAIGAAIIGIGVVDLATFDRSAWQSDYAAIKRGMGQHYANLDWVADERALDLAALDQRTSDRLGLAYSHLQALLALKHFAEAFGDPHLKLALGREANPVRAAADSAPADPPAGESCEAAAYSADDLAFDPRMVSLPGWRQLSDGSFPAGIAGPVGVIRIASFGEDRYLDACRKAFTPGIGDRALQLATRAELQRQLIATIASLKAAGARTMLIDLTGNGGGSEWDREAAGLFTAKAMTRAEPRIADAACDRSAVWSGKRPCAVFAASADATARIQGSGQWIGPVAILADRGTGSAAEEFVGWLVDNRIARLIGTRTAGAGCGYVDGGQPIALKAAPLTLKMPNCARFTATGRNEIEGWAPGAPLDFPAKGEEAAWGRRLIAITLAGG